MCDHADEKIRESFSGGMEEVRGESKDSAEETEICRQNMALAMSRLKYWSR